MKSKVNKKEPLSLNFKSDAQIIFEGKDLLLARPGTMDYREYKILRRIQNEVMKRLFRKGRAPSRHVGIPCRPLQFNQHFHRPSPSLIQYLNLLKPQNSEKG